MRSTEQAGAIIVALAAILMGVLAAGAAAASAPAGIPGVPTLDPPASAPIGIPAAPTSPAAPAAPAATVVAPAAIAAPPAANVEAAAPAAPATPAALPVPSGPPLSNEEHYARGEVLLGAAWLPIDNVFKDYLAARAELQPLDAQAKAARDNIAAIQSQMGGMKNDSFQAEQPIRKDMSKQMSKRRELAKASDAPQPKPPKLQQIPQRPRQYAATMHSQQYSNNYSDPAQQAMLDWQRQVDAITRANDTLQKKYQQDKADWKKAKDDADKELPKIDQAIKDLQGKLDQNATDLTTKQAPLMEKVKAANSEAQAIGRKMEVVQTRIKALADALKAAPETLRFKHSILDWEDAFWPMADLEKQLAESQTEIDRVCQQTKAEAAAADRPLPDNWRHPQQDRMDALRTLITRAKAAR